MTAPAAVQAQPSPWARLHALASTLIEDDGPAARRFENLIMALIALSLVSVGLELLPHQPHWARSLLYAIEVIVVAVFCFEYLMRLIAATSKLGFVFSFYGLVDLLAIAPFFLAGLDLRFLRAL